MDRLLRIGIDGGCLSNRRGFGRFARELVNALSQLNQPHQLVVIVDRPSLESGSVTIPEGLEVVPVDVRVAPSQAASSNGRRSLPDLLAMGRAAANSRLDVLYFPATYSFFPVSTVPRVVTVFDTMALDYPREIFPHWRGRLAWTLKEYIAVGSSRHVVTVSEASRNSIQRRFRLSADRVSVVPCAPSAVFYPRTNELTSVEVLSRYGISPGTRFFLYVGGLSPHKNLLRLIEAFSRLQDPSAQLVLVGDLGDVFHTHVPELRAAVTRHGVDGRVMFPGFVPDADLAHFYSRALALVQPSLIEGFGLPPVEAMACGAPVLSSTAGSLPEVVGEAGRFFNPLDVNSLCAEMSLILNDPQFRNDLTERVSSQSSRFTWHAAAQGVLKVCEEVAQSSRPKHRLAVPTPHLHNGQSAASRIANGSKYSL